MASILSRPQCVKQTTFEIEWEVITPIDFFIIEGFLLSHWQCSMHWHGGPGMGRVVGIPPHVRRTLIPACFLPYPSPPMTSDPQPTDPQTSCHPRADSRFSPSQWETSLLCNNVSHWLGASLESALHPQDSSHEQPNSKNLMPANII